MQLSGMQDIFSSLEMAHWGLSKAWLLKCRLGFAGRVMCVLSPLLASTSMHSPRDPHSPQQDRVAVKHLLRPDNQKPIKLPCVSRWVQGIRSCECPGNSKEELPLPAAEAFPPMLGHSHRTQRSPGSMYTTEPKQSCRKPPEAAASSSCQPRAPPPSP